MVATVTEVRTLEMSGAERRYWQRRFASVLDGRLDTWDYGWVAYCWSRGWLSAVPNVNLVENIGIGPEATHTTGKIDVPSVGALGPITAASAVERDVEADRFTFDRHYRGSLRSLPRRARAVVGRAAAGFGWGDPGQR